MTAPREEQGVAKSRSQVKRLARQTSSISMSLTLAAKVGSLVAHVEEAVSAKGHPFDVLTFKGLLADSEVQEWLTTLRLLALLPVRR